MKIQYRNYYFTNNDSIYIIYDFENNKIISYPEGVCIEKVIEVLKRSDSLSRFSLSEEEQDLYLYLKKNLKETKTIDSFDSFSYLEENEFSITSASLMISQNCNLCCTYCYGGEHGQYHSKTLFMSKNIALYAIKFLIKNNKRIDNEININFFGGEPLLNFELIKYVVQICKTNFQDYNFVFSLTTNATLITDDIADFFIKYAFRVMISIDGYKEIHNYHRKYSNGDGSFPDVIKGIQILREHGVEFRIRATLDSRFYEKYNEINDYLKLLGSDRVTISRLISYNDDTQDFPLDVAAIKNENKYLKSYLYSVVDEVLSGNYPKNFPLLSSFKKIVFAEKSLINCGAYEGGTAISSDGKLYPCHRFVGMKDFDFGNVFDGVNKDKLKKQLASLDENTKYCNNCFGKYICQRSCLRDLAKSGGKYISHTSEYCDILKETINDSLLNYYLILTKRPEFFNTTLNIQDVEL